MTASGSRWKCSPRTRARPSTFAASWPSITSAIPRRMRWCARWRRRYLETGGDLRAVMRAMVANPDVLERDRRRWPRRLITACASPGCAARPWCNWVPTRPGQPNPSRSRAFSRKAAWACSTASRRTVTRKATMPTPIPTRCCNAGTSWRAAGRTQPARAQTWRTPPEAAAQPVEQRAPARRPRPRWVGQRFIDLAAVRLTGRLLTAASNQAALDLLGTDPKPEQYSQTLLFVSLLPETSLR